MSFILSAVPLLNGMKMQRTTRIKRVLSAFTLSAALVAPALAVSHEEKPFSSAEILEHGKLLHKHDWDDGYGGWSHSELMIVYQHKYYICLIDVKIMHCEEKKVFEPTMLGNK